MKFYKTGGRSGLGRTAALLGISRKRHKDTKVKILCWNSRALRVTVPALLKETVKFYIAVRDWLVHYTIVDIASYVF